MYDKTAHRAAHQDNRGSDHYCVTTMDTICNAVLIIVCLPFSVHYLLHKQKGNYLSGRHLSPGWTTTVRICSRFAR